MILYFTIHLWILEALENIISCDRTKPFIVFIKLLVILKEAVFGFFIIQKLISFKALIDFLISCFETMPLQMPTLFLLIISALRQSLFVVEV